MAGTYWVRLDVGYFRNPKAMAAGPQGRALHLASICWAADQLTDGVIPPWALATLLSDSGASRKAVDALVQAGLWLPSENGVGGWLIHDYSDMNGSRSDAEAKKADWRERQRIYRAKKKAEREAEGRTMRQRDMSTGMSTGCPIGRLVGHLHLRNGTERNGITSAGPTEIPPPRAYPERGRS